MACRKSGQEKNAHPKKKNGDGETSVLRERRKKGGGVKKKGEEKEARGQ